jgi:hypothetical protein
MTGTAPGSPDRVTASASAESRSRSPAAAVQDRVLSQPTLQLLKVFQAPTSADAAGQVVRARRAARERATMVRSPVGVET